MKGDSRFFFCFLLFLALGVIVLLSASFAIACERFNDCYFYFKHQLKTAYLPGVFLFLFFSFFDYRFLKKLAFPLLLISIVFLILLFIPQLGRAYTSSVQWLNLGFISFQPSELVKFTLLIYFAALFSKGDFKKNKSSFLIFLLILGIVEFLIIRQPDYGAAILIFLLSLIILFLADVPLSRFFLFLIIGLVSFSLLVFLSPYHLSRISTFISWEGSSLTTGYHLNQAILAIGAGGLFGRGLGYSVQKYFYLPEVISDSIFAVLAEEFGFIFTLGVLAFYVFVFLRILRISGESKDKFGKLLGLSIGFLFILQFLVNVAGMLNLLPLTGLTLPFLSYGGTSFCIFAAVFGIVYNLSKKH